MLTVLPKVDQSWTISRIAKEAAPTSWKSVFASAELELDHISKKLDEERVFGSYIPLKCHIFNAFTHTPLNKVKVIIVDVEPLKDNITLNGKSVPRDIGLAYALHYDDQLTKSLENIYLELKRTYRAFTNPQHGDLRKWTQQGVLLLHQCLTRSINKSHNDCNIWHDFINKVFKGIAEVNPQTIIVLFGRHVQKINPLIPDSFVRLECKCAPNDMKAEDEFIGSNIFKQINDLLIKQKKTPINWSL